MARKRPSVQKRAREQQKREREQRKAAKAAERRQRREGGAPAESPAESPAAWSSPRAVTGAGDAAALPERAE